MLELHQIGEVRMHLVDLRVNCTVDIVPHVTVVTAGKRTLITPEHTVPAYKDNCTGCKGYLAHLVVAVHKGKDPVNTWCLWAADMQLAQHNLIL